MLITHRFLKEKHYICALYEPMKDMTTELFSILTIMVICCIVLLGINSAVCLILKIAAGMPFKKAFRRGCIVLFIPPAAIAYGSLIERNLIKVKEVKIVCEDLLEGFDGYRLVHISDIHARSFQGREMILQKAVERINALEPDMIAFTGDLITMLPDELDGMSDILGRLEPADGVYSVLGNHDYCMYSDLSGKRRTEALEQLVSAERSMGWTLLLNENCIIRHGQDSIAVTGVENTSTSRHFPSRGDLAKAEAGTDGIFRILLSHDPLHWESEIIGKDYPLTLSGHTHAMQFSFLGWCPSRYMFPHYRGLYSTGSQYLHVNVGLGETIFPARIGVRPEITLITLRLRPEIK